jgi:hypothetical protein
MNWIKRAHIFNPQDHPDWAGSHAQVPTVLVKEDVLRIYYADRGPDGRSYTTFLDVDRADPARIVYCHKRPVIGLGKPGTFDDEGLMPAFVMPDGDRIRLYYSGWNRRLTVPYHNATGLAVSDDGGETFTRMFEGPILDRVPLEPYLAVTPCVLREGDAWQMWYISGVEWTRVGGKYEPVYVVKYGRSADGIHWERPNVQSVPSRHPLEAFSHPCVIKSGDLYQMWYCYRHSEDYRDGSGSYRIGYAESRDGMAFERHEDRVGLSVSADGWDSTMICYPYVLRIDGRTLMFYNGNGFGQTGFGYAQLEE